MSISIDGYEKLLMDLDNHLPNLNDRIKYEYELQAQKVLVSSYLLDYNIKPRDILDLLTDNELKSICEAFNIS